MSTDKGKVDGLLVCEEAFKRLISGEPVVSAHVGLARSKITAGIVSVEAGFDRGYLKKSRRAHLPLLAKIEALRREDPNSNSSARVQLKRANHKIDEVVSALEINKNHLQNVIAQNLQLVERVRELENQIQRLERHKAGKSK
ncbi:hypothetical protein [Pseudomonas oleovorans]|uniref:hypothetical protein n=1 Tax=Ectopseudomonas oleovorans TaxID=301 RepID=UPI000CF038DD|nr:hypothetical protein [Pseudomonas oleovorans]PPV39491.1 hypothetical protein C5L43_10790 [Pseudomonas oleovorans]